MFLFLTVPWVGIQRGIMIVVFPDHTPLLFCQVMKNVKHVGKIHSALTQMMDSFSCLQFNSVFLL